MTDLAEIREGWNRAADDPLFNILTVAGKDNGGWDVDDFFDTGHDEIDGALDFLEEHGVNLVGRAHALDFGCGVGRLTQALAEYYDEAVGVDIAGRMTKLARKFAKERNVDNCQFVTASRPHLRHLGATRFDFIYSVITLQHMPVPYQAGYVTEFVRLLTPTGVAMFQVTEGASMDNAHLSMHGVLPGDVFNWVKDAGGTVLDSRPSPHTGDDFSGRMYVVSQ
jgi:cyclopropane fatty-acyl-phospholipid synthase-like methyltransferase